MITKGGPLNTPADQDADDTFTYTIEMCESGDYSLVVTDVSGMCCSSGQGSYTGTLIQPNGTRIQIATGSDFLYQEKHDFALDVVLSPSPPPPPYPQPPPAPPPPPPTQSLTMKVFIKVGRCSLTPG